MAFAPGALQPDHEGYACLRLTKNTCEQYGIPEEPTTKPRQQAKLPPQQPAAPPVVYPPVASHRLPAGASPVVDEPVQVHVSGLHPAMTEAQASVWRVMASALPPFEKGSLDVVSEAQWLCSGRLHEAIAGSWKSE